MADRVGQEIGHYRIVRLLGQGGFAEVYLGEHIHLSTLAALKFLHTRLSPDDIQLFRQEAQLIARLHHPHIVRVLDFGLEGEALYLVMGYAPNGTLRERHPRGQRLPPATVAEYVGQVAEALQYAHEQKVIHRDVKPENMLIGQRGEVLLSDFGVALIAQSTFKTDPASMAGTAPYMAPEQLDSRPHFASDQYALAITAYEWLCGERPFRGSFVQLAYQHKVVAPPSLLARVPGLPRSVEVVIMQALAKTPEQRFPRVADFARALERACQEGSASYSPYPAPVPPASAGLPGSGFASPGLVAPPPPPPGMAPLPQLPLSTVAIYAPVAPSSPGQESPYTLPSSARRSRKKMTRRALLLTGAGIVAGSGLAVYGASALYNMLNETVVTYTGHRAPVYALAWSPGGQWLASGGYDHTVQVWNALNGGQAKAIFRGHTNTINQLVWQPHTGVDIASCSVDNTLLVWPALSAGSPLVRQSNYPDIFNALAWSPDGKYLATGSSDTTVCIWHAQTGGASLFSYPGHTGEVKAVSWSPDSQYVASGGYDHTAQVWKAFADGTALVTVRHNGNVNALAWSPTGRSVASCSENSVLVWEAQTGKIQATFQGHTDEVLNLAWSPDGSKIASCGRDRTVKIWRVASAGSALSTYQGHSSTVRAVAWSPDGTYLASASDDQTVKVWKASQ